jgi:hypothetical protein
VERYWDWVLEVAPPLPRNFAHKFTRNSSYIAAVYMNEEYQRQNGTTKDSLDEAASNACKVS